MQCTFDRPKMRNPRTKSGLRQARKRNSTSAFDSPTSVSSTLSVIESPTSSAGALENARAIPRSSSWNQTSGDDSRIGVDLRLERLCDISIIWKLVDDYITVLYPLLPVVHLPSFRAALSQDRASVDPFFFSLLTSICAQTAVLLPRRFLEYRSSNKNFPYNTPAEFVHRCVDLIMPLRDHQYFDTPSPEKAATAYMLGYAAMLAGINGRARLFWTELTTFMKFARIDELDNHSSWNCIELQLWKKLFWMWYIIEA
jgi:hypothetical protein